jgi:hypothetical protein
MPLHAARKVREHVSCWLALLLLLGRWQVSTRSRPPGLVRANACCAGTKSIMPASMHGMAWHLASMIHGCPRPGRMPSIGWPCAPVADAPTGLASARQHDSCASSAPLWHDSRWHTSRVRTYNCEDPSVLRICRGRIADTVRGPPLIPEIPWYAVLCMFSLLAIHSNSHQSQQHSGRNGIEWPVGCYRPKLAELTFSMDWATRC